MSAYDKPVSKLAGSPELCTGLESLKGSEQQQAQSVIPGLRCQPCQMGIRKPKKSVLRWEREGGRVISHPAHTQASRHLTPTDSSKFKTKPAQVFRENIPHLSTANTIPFPDHQEKKLGSFRESGSP